MNLDYMLKNLTVVLVICQYIVLNITVWNNVSLKEFPYLTRSSEFKELFLNKTK